MTLNSTVLQQRLAQVRKESGLSQQEFSEKLGFLSRTYGAWERGERDPPADLFFALYEKMRVNPLWLVGGPSAAKPKIGMSMAELTGRIVESIEHQESELNLKISPANKRRIAELMFEYFSSEESFDEKQVSMLIKAAT